VMNFKSDLQRFLIFQTGLFFFFEGYGNTFFFFIGKSCQRNTVAFPHVVSVCRAKDAKGRRQEICLFSQERSSSHGTQDVPNHTRNI